MTSCLPVPELEAKLNMLCHGGDYPASAAEGKADHSRNCASLLDVIRPSSWSTVAGRSASQTVLRSNRMPSILLTTMTSLGPPSLSPSVILRTVLVVIGGSLGLKHFGGDRTAFQLALQAGNPHSKILHNWITADFRAMYQIARRQRGASQARAQSASLQGSHAGP